MKKRLLFILCLLFVGSNAAAFAQKTRTITNSDLEKFRQKRLAAERDYRENYARLGFPSPEELNRQREQDKKERGEFAERIRRENLEREKIQNDRAMQQAQLGILQNNLNSQQRVNNGAYYGGGFYTGAYIGSYPFYSYPGYFYGQPRGYYNNYYNNGYRRNGYGARRGGGIFPHQFPQSPGVRINTGGVRISVQAGFGGRH